MSDPEIFVIAPGDSIGSTATPQVYETPYGAVPARLDRLGARHAAWVAAEVSPFAAIYAARAAGATRVVELAPVVALNRLLEPGDLLLPGDLIDLTRHPRYTFFAGKGYGFLSQREPFCPALRAALLGSARALTARSFARGVYLAAEPLPTAPGQFWEADIAGAGVVPTSFLARELELCYAPLCVVTGRAEGQQDARALDRAMTTLTNVLADTAARLPEARDCGCAAAMQAYRDRGDIGPDWRTWIGAAYG